MRDPQMQIPNQLFLCQQVPDSRFIFNARQDILRDALKEFLLNARHGRTAAFQCAPDVTALSVFQQRFQGHTALYVVQQCISGRLIREFARILQDLIRMVI